MGLFPASNLLPFPGRESKEVEISAASPLILISSEFLVWMLLVIYGMHKMVIFGGVDSPINLARFFSTHVLCRFDNAGAMSP